MFSFVSSQDLTIFGLRPRLGGWFAMLLTNCERLHLSGLELVADRDAIDLMESWDVLVEAVRISGGTDDALKFGSDISRGRSIPTR